MDRETKETSPQGSTDVPEPKPAADPAPNDTETIQIKGRHKCSVIERARRHAATVPEGKDTDHFMMCVFEQDNGMLAYQLASWPGYEGNTQDDEAWLRFYGRFVAFINNLLVMTPDEITAMLGFPESARAMIVAKVKAAQEAAQAKQATGDTTNAD